MYNPIVRTFCQLRAALVEIANITREQVRPGTRLEDILPVECRTQVWRELQRKGLRLPDLELSRWDTRQRSLVTAQIAVSLLSGLQYLAAFFTAPPSHAGLWLNSRRAVHFPHGFENVGELTLYLTRFIEHKASGYRWTHNEITFRVRVIVAEQLAHPFHDVRPESSWSDLGAD